MTTMLPSLDLGTVGGAALHVTFDGGRIVTDAGLLAVRCFEQRLGILADLARRLPDPRSPRHLRHSLETLLIQQVYALLAGYIDNTDAQTLRTDPLFQLLADHAPDPERPLASGSTLSRFLYAYTRRDAQVPLEERPAAADQQQALTARLTAFNDFLVDLFIRTRRQRPDRVVVDVDPTDDPTHGQQTLSSYHGYYRQHQYFPLLLFDGATGFPLGAWLRPGTVHASSGAVDLLRRVVGRLRTAWPDLELRLRGDQGLAVPEMYDYCEQHAVGYALGYASNAVLQARTATALADVELYFAWYGRREPLVQRFEDLRNYQAGDWPHPRRIVAKIEVHAQGSQRRFVVTNLPDPAAALYRDFYVQRGAVPEQPIGELKNGLHADRLSAHGFRANGLRLLLHVVAYAVVVLLREAVTAIPEIAHATVSTLRERLWKVGAMVRTTARRTWVQFSACWPQGALWSQVWHSLVTFAQQRGPWAAPAP
jgi:hypothetical protein